MISSVSRQDELRNIRHLKICTHEEIQLEETLVVDPLKGQEFGVTGCSRTTIPCQATSLHVRGRDVSA